MKYKADVCEYFLCTCDFIDDSQNKSCNSAVNYASYSKSYKARLLRSRNQNEFVQSEGL
jgi:hypothetical protein